VHLIKINKAVKRRTRFCMPAKGDEWQRRDMRYKLQSSDQLRACLGRVPDDIRVEVERGLAVTAETVADLRSLSEFATGFDPRQQQ
jgi:hypothetical protein